MSIADPGFGENVRIDTHLRELLDTAPAMCATDAQLLLRDRYETVYGIHDHSRHENRPLALVAMHLPEDASSNSLLYERLNVFAENKVAQVFGISIVEFLAMPFDISSELLLISAKRRNSEEAAATDIINNLTAGK